MPLALSKTLERSWLWCQRNTNLARYHIHLYYYDEVLKQKHRSSASLFISVHLPDKVIALSENAFLVSSLPELSATYGVVTLKDNCGKSTYCHVDKDSNEISYLNSLLLR